MKKWPSILFMLCWVSCVFAQIPQGNKVRKDVLSRLYVYPERIMWTSHDTLFENKEFLLERNNGQPEMGKRHTCGITTTAQDTASILLDYGKELHGGIKLVFSSSKPGGPKQVHVRFGESVSEANSHYVPGKRGMGYATNDHAIRDMILTVPSDGQIEIGNTGFRFVRIDFLSQAKVYLKEVPAILRYRDIPYLGSFECNDSMLNRIWQTGAYTVHLNMQEYLWDGIKRDRLIWLGDMHPEVSTVMSVFGGNEVVPSTLDLACEQFPLPQWLNGMSSYSMWYLIIMYDWFMYGGDKAYLNKHRNYITGLIDLIDSKIDKKGNETLSPNRFLDWPSTPNKKGVEAGYRALLIWALEDAQMLCEELGDTGRAEKCVAMVKRLRKKYVPDNGLKQAAALMAIAGVIKPENASTVVAAGGAKGFSTFYGYYMLEAMAKASLYADALDIIRNYWGGMIKLGATTFWEDFDLDWAKNAGRIDEFVPKGKADIHRDFGAYCYPSYRHSFCHGWASGPTPWLSRYVLGVKILEPGCKKVEIKPHLGNLKWASGTFPTPLGVIRIKHELQPDGKVKTEVKAPDGVEVLY